MRFDDQQEEKVKRGSNGMLWEFYKRMSKLNKMKNGIKHYNKNLLQVMTFSECEIVYMLPKNQVMQDMKTNKIRSTHYRKSNNTYLITIIEAKRLYEEYHTQRAFKDERELYSGYDGKKMTEYEYYIKHGRNFNDKT